jgi:hypothetical protein
LDLVIFHMGFFFPELFIFFSRFIDILCFFFDPKNNIKVVETRPEQIPSPATVVCDEPKQNRCLPPSDQRAYG